VSLLGIAKLEASVRVDIAGHVVGDRTGAGTTISGLRPAAVAPDGIVPSLKSGVGTVLEGGSIEAALLARELAREVASGAVVVGLHVPEIVDVPNGDMIGSGATEEDDEDIDPVVTVVLLVAAVAELVTSVVGHMMIPPSEAPGIGPTLPRLS
jgi:hypothetical protein